MGDRCAGFGVIVVRQDLAAICWLRSVYASSEIS